MKESRYNFFFTYKDVEELTNVPAIPESDYGKIVAYNSLSGALALVDEDEYSLFLISKGTGFSDLSLKIHNDFKKGGFIIEDDIDELSVIRFYRDHSRYSGDYLGLTIAPTRACNFNCTYCYEKSVISNEKMDEETIDNLLDFVKGRIGFIKRFTVTWYGGEPLLAPDVIKKLSEKFINLCDKNQVEYSASIITNGYLFSDQIGQLLHENKVSSVQITLDGNEKTHNERRPLKNGEPTFKQIISNLKNITKYIPLVSLRVNIDKDNIEAGENVKNIIRDLGLSGKIHLYTARVDNYNNEYVDNKCLHGDDFNKLSLEFNLSNMDNERLPYPRKKWIFCSADSNNSYVIDSDGKIYKCWNDIGLPKRSIGNLRDGVRINSVFLQFMTLDVTKDLVCRDCNLLPICAGGCPEKRIHGENICIEYKNTLKEYLLSIVRKRKLIQGS